MKLEDLKKKIVDIENELALEIEAISTFIFEHPELGGEEFQSSQYLTDILREYGFEVIYPYLGIPTAFRAEIGQGGAAFSFLAEYDALPGYGSRGEPGHACGHNWIAATSVGSALVLSRLKKYFSGKIVVFGTPAEETVGSKVDLIKGGAFHDIDAVLQLHLENGNLLNTRALAMDAFEFRFRGKAAHAASFPYEGINALDAVNLTFAGINALRQHVKPDVRIHGIISKGGHAPNIVPEDCSCLFYVRANHRKYLNHVSDKVINCAKGAALMTGTDLEIQRPENSFDDLVNNPVLKKYTEENLRSAGFEYFKEYDECPGSSDIGNVSHVVPTIYGNIDIGTDVAVHEREFLDYADGKEAKKQMHKAVKAMASTALDILLQTEVLDEVKRTFKNCKI